MDSQKFCRHPLHVEDEIFNPHTCHRSGTGNWIFQATCGEEIVAAPADRLDEAVRVPATMRYETCHLSQDKYQDLVLTGSVTDEVKVLDPNDKLRKIAFFKCDRRTTAVMISDGVLFRITLTPEYPIETIDIRTGSTARIEINRSTYGIPHLDIAISRKHLIMCCLTKAILLGRNGIHLTVLDEFKYDESGSGRPALIGDILVMGLPDMRKMLFVRPNDCKFQVHQHGEKIVNMPNGFSLYAHHARYGIRGDTHSKLIIDFLPPDSHSSA
jgi:hypothetical protein